MKTCARCKTPKPFAQFNRNRCNKDGYSSCCKTCRKRVTRTDYVKNREKRKESSRKYRIKNKEKVKIQKQIYQKKYSEQIKERMRRWRTLNHEHRILYRKTYNLEHAEQVKAYEKIYRQSKSFETRERMKKWRHKNRVRLKHYAKSYQKTHAAEIAIRQYLRRAKFKTTIVEKINPLDIAERDGWRCHLCNRIVSRSTLSLDHLIPIVYGGPHIAENVALAHIRCNSRRGAGRLPAQLRLFG